MILKIIFYYVLLNMFAYFSIAYYRLRKEETIIKNGWVFEKEFDSLSDFLKEMKEFLIPIRGQIGFIYILVITVNTVRYKKEELNGIIKIRIPFTKISLMYDDNSLKEALSKKN